MDHILRIYVICLVLFALGYNEALIELEGILSKSYVSNYKLRNFLYRGTLCVEK